MALTWAPYLFPPAREGAAMEFILDRLVRRYGLSKVMLAYLAFLTGATLIFIVLARYVSSTFYVMAAVTVTSLLVGLKTYARVTKDQGVQAAPKGFLIDLLLPPDRAEDALFNILGRYDYWVAKHGVRRARVIFVTQSIFAVISYWSDWLLKRLKLLDLLRRL